MNTTSEFVKKLSENEEKQKKNQKRGKDDPESKLPNKQHSQGV
jgi:hypothetical protein